MRRANAIAILATPALSFGTLAIGLGLGAHGETIAAMVYGAPPGIDRLGVAWQIEVMREDRGVRELSPNLPLLVHAKWRDVARDWRGTTSSDGAAEIWLDFPTIAVGDEIDLTVTTGDEEKEVLARARACVPGESASHPRGNITRGWLPSLHRDGAIAVDVAMLGGGLAAEFPSEVWVRARDREGHAVAGAQVHVEPIPGLTFTSNDATTCDAGWAKLDVVASALTADATIQVKSGAIVGSWDGPWPIVLGATRATVSEDDAGNLHAIVIRPLVTKNDAYVEIDDEAGRVFGATVGLSTNANDFANKTIDLPKLSPGKYWIVATSDPRAAETMPAGAFAIPFRVPLPTEKKSDEKSPENSPEGRTDDCAAAGELATLHARGFARSVVVDGFVGARSRGARTRKRGLGIALAALALGAIVEALLILRAARGGSRVDAAWITRTPGAVVIGVGLSLLGFAMLAAFVATH